MALPRISIWPSTRALGTVSCMRLMHRSSVDFPHPDGPMIAVTACCGIASDTSLTAGAAPKYAHRCSVMTLGLSGALVLCASATTTRGDTTFGIMRGLRAASIDWSTESRSRDEACSETDHQHYSDQHEGARPCLCMPFVVGADSVRENLERQSSDRLPHRRGPELISESGEKKRRCFAGYPCHRDERSSRNAGECRAHHH